MRQVPDKKDNPLTLVGSGRMARHFSHYLNLLNIPHYKWSRQEPIENLRQLSTQSSKILLLISDDAIESFVSENPFLMNEFLIHMSGSKVFDCIYGVHPLMTFGPDLYGIETYRSIWFATERGSLTLSEILPFLPNRAFHIDPEQKALYHALCVCLGNFTTIMANEVFGRFDNTLDVPHAALLPYLQQVVSNLHKNHEQALTGPLVRGDQNTIHKNLQALKGSPLEGIYTAYLELFRTHSNQLQEDTPNEHASI